MGLSINEKGLSTKIFHNKNVAYYGFEVNLRTNKDICPEDKFFKGKKAKAAN
ncbi:hypothetical protein TUMSATVNIG1_25670 [Vibrio nigripulchritudo]|nr:hypothetical protein VNTUMSATTG_25400 [Vibrio nigripulchritudo]BDU31958.1 hypothetical protein TUMSATVNIG1_25670 [Vibrio nigripulchritudo]